MSGILFGGKSQPFFELSPFYYCTYTLGGARWRTYIHYWIASCFKDENTRDMIRNINSYERVLALARKNNIHDFNIVSPDNLLNPIQCRLTQNRDILDILLSTGSSELVYSGKGYLGNGNRYGRVLMRVRDIYSKL